MCRKSSGSQMSWLGRQWGKLRWHHWVTSLWLAVVAVNASPLQPTAQLLFSNNCLAMDLLGKKKRSQSGSKLGSCHELWSCLGPPAFCSNHSKNLCMSPFEAHGVQCVQFAFYSRKTIIRGISLLCNLIQTVVEAKRRKSWGKNVPSSQIYPVHIFSSFLPLHHQPHCERQQDSDPKRYWQLEWWLAFSVSSSSLHHTKADFIQARVRPLTFDHK